MYKHMFQMFFGMCFWCQICVDLGLYFLVCGNVILIPEGGRCIFFPIQSEEPDVCFRLLVAGVLVDGFLLSIFLCPSSFFGTLNVKLRCLFAISQGETFV
jgi:hypothetical protein